MKSDKIYNKRDKMQSTTCIKKNTLRQHVFISKFKMLQIIENLLVLSSIKLKTNTLYMTSVYNEFKVFIILICETICELNRPMALDPL